MGSLGTGHAPPVGWPPPHQASKSKHEMPYQEDVPTEGDASTGSDVAGDTSTRSHFEKLWMERYEELVQFKLEFGHCLVPQKAYARNPQLGEWVRTQRRYYQRGKVREDRLQLLNELGFNWNARFVKGLRKKKKDEEESSMGHPDVNEWTEYETEEDGDTDVDVSGNGNMNEESNEVNDCTYGNDDGGSERRGLESSMTEVPEQRTPVQPLRGIGKGKWLSMLEKLRAYRTEFGNCDVPRYYPDDPQLGIWVDRQRVEMKKLFRGKKSRLKWEQFGSLENLGFKFSIRSH